MKRKALFEAKEELKRLKEEMKIKETSNIAGVKAVRSHITLKAIARQWINNTYDQISRKEQVRLKLNARYQCLSPEVTFEWCLLQNPGKELDILWKPEFIIQANGEWFPHGEPITPPTSPRKNNQGKMFSFSENIQEAHVEEDCLETCQKKMNTNDGPTLTKEMALADMIELWFKQKYTTGTKLYSNFWKEPLIQRLKDQDYFKDFGDMMENALELYSSGKKLSFKSSKTPFKMDDTLSKHMDIILWQYNKHRNPPLNPRASEFIPQFI